MKKKSMIVKLGKYQIIAMFCVFMTLGLTNGIVSSLIAEEAYMRWEKTFGGSSEEIGLSVQKTSDGGYIILGDTKSFGAGDYDVYLIKTDSEGNLEWDETYGGTSYDVGYEVQETVDGGYIIAGITYSFGAGSSDIYVIKTDPCGVLEWQKTFGGSSVDDGHSVRQTADGGYIVGGQTQSYGAGDKDMYLIKLDEDGNEEWSNTYGASGKDHGYFVRQTSDLGYIITGDTQSYGAGSADVYLVKTDPCGVLEWQKTYGGTGYDEGGSVKQTADGGYIIGGRTNTYGAGDYDFYLIKTDPCGILDWQKWYGGSAFDHGKSVQQTQDGGYVFAGYTYSYGAGSSDAYIIKTDSVGNVQWENTCGGALMDSATSIQEIAGSEYIFTGKANGASGVSDVYLVKLTPPMTWHVDTITGDDGNDGRSRETAFETIQKGVQVAVDYDTVLVWPGEYQEDVDYQGKAITVRAAADAPHLKAISGSGHYAVSFHTGEGRESILENIVVRDSFAGIHAEGADPTLRFLTVVDNEQGIIADSGGDPCVSNCILWDNENGDLIGCDASYSLITDDRQDIVDGLAAYWSLDEGTGTTANDYSGNDNDGTLTNDPCWVEGVSAKALYFESDNKDYVEVQDDSSLNPTNEITITAWFKATYFRLGTYSWPAIVKKSDFSQTHGFGVEIGKVYEGTPVMGGSVHIENYGPCGISDNIPVETDIWYFTAGVYDGIRYTQYLGHDGEPLIVRYSCDCIGNLEPSTNKLFIGGDPSNPSETGRYFDGYIDEVSMYDRALSPDEIEQLYLDGLSGIGTGDPRFGDPCNDDFHLKSERGRFWAEAPTDPNEFGELDGLWAMDSVTSPCVDGGDPMLEPEAEGDQNGGRVNMGAYANTAYASKSEYPLPEDLDRDGVVDLDDFCRFSEKWLEALPWGE